MALHTLDELKNEVKKRPLDRLPDLAEFCDGTDKMVVRFVSNFKGFSAEDGLRMILNGWFMNLYAFLCRYNNHDMTDGNIEAFFRKYMNEQNPKDDGSSDKTYEEILKNVDRRVDDWLDARIAEDEKRKRRIEWLQQNRGTEAANAYKYGYR